MKRSFATAKLGDQGIASVIFGQSPPSSTYNKTGDGMPFFQGKADFGLLHPVPQVWCNAGQKFATEGDILISVRAPVGDVNVAIEKCSIGRGIAAIRSGLHVDPWFLYFAILYMKPALESRATGSTFASVNKAVLLDLDIPLPKRKEQFIVGDFLRNLVIKIEQENFIISYVHELKYSVMQTLFTRGLNNEQQKDTGIGGMPESWRLASIGDLFEIRQGLSLKGNLSDDDQGLPFLRTSNIYWGCIKLNSVSRMHIDPEMVGDRVLKQGDLLVCEGGDIGRAAVWNDEIANCTFQNHLHRLRPTRSSQIVPKFAMFWLEEAFCHRDIYKGAGNRTTIPNLSRARLAELLMPVPSLNEQKQIVHILETIDRKIDLHHRKKVVLDDLFKSLLHKLMTGEIRVADLNFEDDGEGTDVSVAENSGNSRTYTSDPKLRGKHTASSKSFSAPRRSKRTR